MRFYDAHIHCPGKEAGGFIVGLEGTPWFDGILHNEEAEAVAQANPAYKFVRYVTREEALQGRGSAVSRGILLKYHPRREKYTPDEMISSIRALQPKAVMIDTLNEPGWMAYDYWKVCRAFPDLTFILPHAGGYLINDFIKICHFQPNVWIDFTLTHTNFGSISKNPLPYVDQAIAYALNSPFRNRVLMGSDLPFFDQMDVVRYYDRLGKLDMLNENFERLSEILV
jgi:hypothetical protein